MTGNQKCAYCNRSKEEVPLIQLVYKEQASWICPQHLPILIHKPQMMSDVLPGAENLSAGEHDH
jgi:hypothetical protein